MENGNYSGGGGSGGGGEKQSQRLPLSDVVSDCVRRWFQDTLKEAKAGDLSMQVLVAQMYSNGYGIPKDHQKSHLPVDRNENETNDKSDHDNEVFNSVEDGNLIVSSEVNVVKLEEVIPQPASAREQFGKLSTSGRDIIRPSSTSSLPPGDDEMPNGIRPMKVQRPRTPLIDAVAAHDKSKLRKVSERAMPPVPKEEERDTLLEQIRMKSFNLKPAVQTRPSIQGPSTNLRVAAILEKANAIRQAFAGSDDDEDDNDSWSDS